MRLLRTDGTLSYRWGILLGIAAFATRHMPIGFVLWTLSAAALCIALGTQLQRATRLRDGARPE